MPRRLIMSVLCGLSLMLGGWLGGLPLLAQGMLDTCMEARAASQAAGLTTEIDCGHPHLALNLLLFVSGALLYLSLYLSPFKRP